MSKRSGKRKGKGESKKIFAGRYAYKKPLGRGAGGSVYLAEDLLEGGRDAALKVLSAEACETVQGKMLRREFEILSKLNHPNLVKVYDYGTLPDGGVFLAEEYIDGFSLQDARALLDPEALIDTTLQILQGLAYLHGMGMIHRDIKPANVMLLWLDDASAKPMVKVVDFGLSSMNPKRDTLRGGTRSYMAPEIIRGDKAEQRSDLYSLGVTLYYALCGVLPFGPRSKEDPPPTEEDFRPPEPHRLNEDVPLELSRFTMALLRQLPDVGYVDAGEALQALAADVGEVEERSVGQMANSLDVAAAPVIQGYFERGILSRRIEEDDLILEWLSMGTDPSLGQMYLIRGEAGVGKSRLLHDVQASSKLSGHLVLSHQCEEKTGPYGLLCEMVDRIMEVARSHGVMGVDKHEPALWVRKLLSNLGKATVAAEHDPAQSERWMYTAIEDAVGFLAPYKVVFFIDDIDGADEESLAILHQWYREAKAFGRPAIVATTERGEVYQRFSRQKGVQVLPIEGVGKSDVRAFFRDQLGIERISDDWLDSVAEACDGRPAYIEELCRYLIDAGMLWRKSANRWDARVDDIEAAGVPANLRESLRRRITAVGAGGRECLELMALMERPLTWESARKLLERGGSSAKEADKTLLTLQWRHLVEMDLRPRGRYVRGVHGDLAEAVVDMLSPEWRRALHRRIGEQMARDWSRGRGEAREAATHLEAGGRTQEAAPYFEIAGDRAFERGLQEEASSYYERALSGTSGAGGSAWLHRKLAIIELAQYNPSGCREHYERAMEAAAKAASPWLTARVYLDAARAEFAVGEVEKALALHDELERRGVAAAVTMESKVFEARLRFQCGDLEKAEALLEECRREVGAGSELRLGAEIAALQATIDALRGAQTKALQGFERARTFAEATDDAVVLGTVLVEYGVTLRRLDSLVEAQELLFEALPLLLGREVPDQFVEALFQLAWIRTDLRGAKSAWRRALEAAYLARRLGHRSHRRKLQLLLGRLALTDRQSHPGGAREFDEAVEAFDRGEYFPIDRAEILMAVGDLMITLQMTDRGPLLLQKGRQMAYEMGANGLLPPVEG